MEETRAYERRVVGDLGTAGAGGTLLVCCGIHGNEPAGVLASRRVFERLGKDGVEMAGRFIAIAGNLAALNERRRFVDRDLNRMWMREDVAAVRRSGRPSCSEERELLEIHAVLDPLLETEVERLVFLDLHSASAEGPPFCCLGDTLPNRKIAFALGLPAILGLEETIDGGLLEYLNNRGCRAVGIEGGQHGDPRTVDRLEAAIWITLATMGFVDEREVEAVPAARQLLVEAVRGVPRVVEILVRHSISEEDAFRMEPGFGNFHQVEADQVLARDRGGEVRAELGGRLLLPLYQGQGNDGYFLGRDVLPFWLGVSRWLRRLRLQWTLRLLPGVSRDPHDPSALLVDPRIARFQVTNLFHLFGYRRCRPRDEHLVFTRRLDRPPRPVR